MAGIYLHIPFCKSKCLYCNFFSVASLSSRQDFLRSLQKEIMIRKDFLAGKKIKTIYFGGGTPSLISSSEINSILENIRKVFSAEDTTEITLEANPDDINTRNLQDWQKAGINRLSIGIQSFADEDLAYLGRTHNGVQAERSVRLALENGFSNVSLDFIYGMPTLSDTVFETNLEKAVNLGIPHISAYALTVEPKTGLEVMIRKNRIQGPDEEKTVSRFRFLMQYLGSRNYEHYEISNFCLPGMYSQHNSSYWKGDDYLGLGPSAHSFNGTSRQWNVSSISQYIDLIGSCRLHFETEILTMSQKFNEYVMVSLRTIWGVSLDHINKTFGENSALHFKTRVLKYLESEEMLEHEEIFTLSDKGKLFADKISADLFLDND